jgi:hypothetical protein
MILFYTFMAICIAFSVVYLLFPVIGKIFFVIIWPLEKVQEITRRVRGTSFYRCP